MLKKNQEQINHAMDVLLAEREAIELPLKQRIRELEYTVEASAAAFAERDIERHNRIVELEAEVADYEATFDLRWKADMRAIKRWREAHPGNDLVQPDHADLCVWLMEENAKLRDRIARLEAALREIELRRKEACEILEDSE
ncbi:MAG: hypothetical protein ABIH23_35160 [bacterium]